MDRHRRVMQLWRGDEVLGAFGPGAGDRRARRARVLDRPLLRGAPSGHIVTIREVRLSAGAEFIVMIYGASCVALPELGFSHRRAALRSA